MRSLTTLTTRMHAHIALVARCDILMMTTGAQNFMFLRIIYSLIISGVGPGNVVTVKIKQCQFILE